MYVEMVSASTQHNWLMKRHFRVRWRSGSLAWTPSGCKCRLRHCVLPLTFKGEGRERERPNYCIGIQIPVFNPGNNRPLREQD